MAGETSYHGDKHQSHFYYKQGPTSECFSSCLPIGGSCDTFYQSQVVVQSYQLDGLNWDASNEKQELHLTIPSTGEKAVFKTKQIHLVKTALSKFVNLRAAHLSAEV